MQNSLKEVHEFIADDETIRSGQNTSIYVDFLVNNAYGIYSNTLTNTFFNKNLLKNRIMMLHQKKSGMAARLKFLILLPLLAGLLCMSTLAFAKNYGWIDLAPSNNSASLSSTDYAVKINRLKVTQGSITAITDKILIRERKEKTSIYTVRNLTESDKNRLLRKYNIKIVIVEAIAAPDGKLEEMIFPILVKADKNIRASNKDSINKSKIRKVNKQIDSAIKGEIKKTVKSQTDQQKISNAPPPPSGSYSGFNTLYTYLEKHIRYPAKYFENRIVDNVIAEFTVAADHKISSCKIKNDAKPFFAEEVSRQLKAYTDTVNRTPGTYFFLIQFNLFSNKGNKSWHPSDKYLNLTSKTNCAGNIEVFAYVKDE
jgi:hypothetical protein